MKGIKEIKTNLSSFSNAITIHNSVCEVLSPYLDFTGQPTVPRGDLSSLTVDIIPGTDDFPAFPEYHEDCIIRFRCIYFV